jgi:hypothetical protein
MLFGQEAAFDDAHRRYLKELKDEKKGVYEKGEFVFFLSDIPLNGLKSSTLEKSILKRESLLDHKKLVSRHIIKKHSLKRSEIPESSILSKFEGLKELIEDGNSGFFDQMIEFQLPCVVLENTRRKEMDVLRYAVAYRKVELKKVVPKQINWPSNARVLAELAKRQDLNERLDRQEDQAKFDRITNNFIEPLGIASDLLAGEYNLIDRTDFSDLGHAEFYRRIRVAENILDKNNSVANAKKVLANLPLYPKALETLKNHYLAEEGDQSKAFILYLIGLPTHSESNSSIEMVKFDFTKQKQSAFSSEMCMLELNELLHSVQNYVLQEELSRTSAFRHNFYKLGFNYFPEHDPKPPSEVYKQAQLLFDSGRELPKIINLSLSEVESNPDNKKAWNLLGRSLSIEGFDLLAVPCFLQSILANEEDDSLHRVNLAISLQNLGYLELAKGLALSVLLDSAKESWQTSQACEVLDISL